MSCFIGMDLSLNHGALVEVDEAGDLVWFNYYAEKVGSAKQHPDAMRLKPPDSDAQFMFVWKLAFIDLFLRVNLGRRLPTHAALEDFAYRAEQGAHQLGSVGGTARLACWRQGSLRLRIFNPGHVKMFGARNGSAGKDEMVEEVRSHFGVDFSRYNQPLANPTKKNPEPQQDTTTEEDLTDAFVLARMVRVEALVRAGRMMLSELPSEKMRKPFTVTTKTYPVCVLDRDWICRDGEQA